MSSPYTWRNYVDTVSSHWTVHRGKKSFAIDVWRNSRDDVWMARIDGAVFRFTGSIEDVQTQILVLARLKGII